MKSFKPRKSYRTEDDPFLSSVKRKLFDLICGFRNVLTEMSHVCLLDYDIFLFDVYSMLIK